MTKGNYMVAVAALFLLDVAGSARAQPVAVSVDGCAELARAVYEEVSGAAIHGSYHSGPWVISPRFEHVSVCETAARTVSRAFTLAMASSGIDIRWSEAGAGPRPGDVCLSAFLSQCYPNRGGLPGQRGGADAMFVRTSWAVVSQSVMRTMANPYSSDEVRFRPNDLKLRIGLALRSIDRLN